MSGPIELNIVDDPGGWVVGDMSTFDAGAPYGEGWWMEDDPAAPADAADDSYAWGDDGADDSADDSDDDGLGR